MTIHIREAVPDDLAEVLDMKGHLARHHGGVPKISLTELQRQIQDQRPGHLLVAAEPEGLVGYALILSRPNLVTGGAGHDINHLFVAERRRRAGIGRALIDAVRQISRAAGAECLTIGTQSGNLGAQSAYRALGLEELPASGPRFAIALE